MSKKIALVNLRYKVDINFERKESLALGYLSSTLKSQGFSVDIIDAQFYNLSVEEVYHRLQECAYDFIGFSLYQETEKSFSELYKLLELTKKNTHYCLGGQFPSFSSDVLLKKYPLVDSIIIGEGELTFLALVESWPDDGWKNIPGICYLENDKLIYTESRHLISNLDLMPFPDRGSYYNQLKDPLQETAILSASRGCYANCSFCSIKSFYKKLQGKAIRVRQPLSVIDEIEEITKNFGIKNFFFADDNFLATNLVQKGWMDQFIQGIENRQLNINFVMDCRVDDIDKVLFKRLKKIGLRGVFLGIESFTQRMLDTLNKQTTVNDNILAIRLLRELRLNVWMGFIMFDMFTTPDEIRENVDALDSIDYFRYINYDRPVSSDWVASDLQLYNGTPILTMMLNQYPDLLVKNDLGYSFQFKHQMTAAFHKILSLWKPTVKQMIQMDTLKLIQRANELGESEVSSKLHLLSRKYMLLDREVFLKLLATCDDKKDMSFYSEIFRYGFNAFLAIKTEVDKLRSSVAH